jgi:alpha-1,3-rhamnosyl/mannosyltransferase
MMRLLLDARVVKGELTGVETYTIELLRRLAGRAGLEKRGKGQDGDRYGGEGVTALCREPSQATLVRKLVDPRLPIALADRQLQFAPRRWLRQHGPFDLLHCPTPLFPFFRKPPGLPLVCTVHDVTPRFAPQWHRRSHGVYFRWILPLLFPMVDHFVADSQATADDLRRWYRVSGRPVTVVPLASRYAPVLEAAPKLSYFLAVGTIEPRKNLENTVRGFLAFKQRHPADNHQLVIAGRGGWGQVAWRAIAEDRSDIRWTGYVDDVTLGNLYREARALVYPSLYEGFGLPVLEAMALGCPVVTTRLSSLPEVGGDAVVYVDPHDPTAIGEAIGRLAFEPAFAESLAVRGLERAGQFDWDRTAEETLAVYESVVRKNGG